MTPDDIKHIEASLDSLLGNQPLALPTNALPEGIERRLALLSAQIQETQAFAVKLSAGELDADPPPRKNHISAGLKQLQAQMLHLTWQAQRVAKGDYGQQVDFMGAFSNAFNEMVDQLRHREQSLRKQQQVMEQIFNLIEPIIVVSQEDSRRVLYANKMAILRFGVHPDKALPCTDVVRRLWMLPLASDEQELYDDTCERWYSVAVHSIQWGEEQHARLYYCQDITAHKQRETRLDLEANTDKLTGLNNRRAFERSFNAQWVSCREANKPLSVILFDIDMFKQFNDTHGHLEGDKVLVSFAEILSKCISRSDDIVARYGGEEFIAALPFTSLDSAVSIANEVCEMTRRHIIRTHTADGEPVQTTFAVSGGVCSAVPKLDIDPSQLILGADQALYDAKQAGRDRIRCCAAIPPMPVCGTPDPTPAAPPVPDPEHS